MPVCSTNKDKSTNTEFKKTHCFTQEKNPALNKGGEFSSTVAANLVERYFPPI
jgi:hypothetical protein